MLEPDHRSTLDMVRLDLVMAVLERDETEGADVPPTKEGLDWLRQREHVARRRHAAVVSQHERQRPFEATRRPRLPEAVAGEFVVPGVLVGVLPAGVEAPHA